MPTARDDGLAITFFVVAIGGGVAVAIAADITAPLCRAAQLGQPTGQPYFGCLEFWLNRYQTLITGFFTVAAVWVAWNTLQQQRNRDIRDHAINNSNHLESRQRSIDLRIDRAIMIKDTGLQLKKDVSEQLRSTFLNTPYNFVGVFCLVDLPSLSENNVSGRLIKAIHIFKEPYVILDREGLDWEILKEARPKNALEERLIKLNPSMSAAYSNFSVALHLIDQELGDLRHLREECQNEIDRLTRPS